jgi:hypothetical protein
MPSDATRTRKLSLRGDAWRASVVVNIGFSGMFEPPSVFVCSEGKSAYPIVVRDLPIHRVPAYPLHLIRFEPMLRRDASAQRADHKQAMHQLSQPRCLFVSRKTLVIGEQPNVVAKSAFGMQRTSEPPP